MSLFNTPRQRFSQYLKAGYDESKHPRDARGRWTSAGGSAARRAVTPLLNVRTTLLPVVAAAMAARFRLGARVSVGRSNPLQSIVQRFFPLPPPQVRMQVGRPGTFPRPLPKPIPIKHQGETAFLIKAKDGRGIAHIVVADNYVHPIVLAAGNNAGGRVFFQDALALIRDVSVATGAKSIIVRVNDVRGGYTWSRLGFQLVDPKAPDSLKLKQVLEARSRALATKGVITPGQSSAVQGLLKNWDAHTPTRIARLRGDVDTTKLSGFQLASGEPTVGSVVLFRTEGEYILPREKFAALGRTMKRAR